MCVCKGYINKTNTKFRSTSSRRLTSLKREMTWRRGTPTAKRVLLCCGVVLGRAPRVQSLALVSLLATVRRSAPPPRIESRVFLQCNPRPRLDQEPGDGLPARNRGGETGPLSARLEAKRLGRVLRAPGASRQRRGRLAAAGRSISLSTLALSVSLSKRP